MCVRFPYNVRESNFVQNEHKKVKACVIIMRVHICSMFQNSIHADQIADVQIHFFFLPKWKYFWGNYKGAICVRHHHNSY